MKNALLYIIFCIFLLLNVLACNQDKKTANELEMSSMAEIDLVSKQDQQKQVAFSNTLANPIENIQKRKKDLMASLGNYEGQLDNITTKKIFDARPLGDSVAFTAFYNSEIKIAGQPAKVRTLYYWKGEHESMVDPQIPKFSNPVQIFRETYYDKEGNAFYIEERIDVEAVYEEDDTIYKSSVSNEYYFESGELIAWRQWKDGTWADKEVDWLKDPKNSSHVYFRIQEIDGKAWDDLAYDYEKGLELIDPKWPVSFEGESQEETEMGILNALSMAKQLENASIAPDELEIAYLDNLHGQTQHKLLFVEGSIREWYLVKAKKIEDAWEIKMEYLGEVMDSLEQFNGRAADVWLYLYHAQRLNDENTLWDLIDPKIGLQIEFNGEPTTKRFNELTWQNIPRLFIGDWTMDVHFDEEGEATLSTAIPGEYVTFTLTRVGDGVLLSHIKGNSH